MLLKNINSTKIDKNLNILIAQKKDHIQQTQRIYKLKLYFLVQLMLSTTICNLQRIRHYLNLLLTNIYCSILHSIMRECISFSYGLSNCENYCKAFFLSLVNEITTQGKGAFYRLHENTCTQKQFVLTSTLVKCILTTITEQ